MSGAGLPYELSNDNVTWFNYPPVSTTLAYLLHLLATYYANEYTRPHKYVRIQGEVYVFCETKYLPLRTLTTLEREYYGV